MRKIKVFGTIAKKIGKGIIDAVLPNLKNSIKPAPTDFINEPNKYEIDWLRMVTAIVTFICLVLLITDTIDYNKFKQLIEAWKFVFQ